MRKIKWCVETGYVSCKIEGELEVDDNLPDTDIDDLVYEQVMNNIGWSWWED